MNEILNVSGVIFILYGIFILLLGIRGIKNGLHVSKENLNDVCFGGVAIIIMGVLCVSISYVKA